MKCKSFILNYLQRLIGASCVEQMRQSIFHELEVSINTRSYPARKIISTMGRGFWHL